MIETSADVTELAKALAVFQGKIGAVGKDSTAKVEKDGRLLYSYKYADLASVLEATREERAAAGLSVVQFPTGGAEGITLVTTLLHTSGQWMRGDLTLRPMDAKPQTIGSLITYLRRYSYSAALGIATEEDDDGSAASGVPKGGGARPASGSGASTPSSSTNAAPASNGTAATHVEAPVNSAKRQIAGGAQPANKVTAKPGEPMSVQGQWEHIHRMRADIPGWAGDHSHPEHEYSKALRAYKKHDGTPCASSKDLTFDQAKNLIQRMDGKVQRNDERARDMGYEHRDMATIDAIREAIAAKEADGDESLEMDVLSLYGVNKLSELPPEHLPGALALALAWKTGSYVAIRQKIASQLQ